MITDPIADMLTRIRNANSISRSQVDVPHSRLKESIIKKLKQEGFIKNYEIVEGSPRCTLRIYLKYGPDGEKVIREVRRVSKPGRRIYQGTKDLKSKVLNGLGIAILSTPKGVLTDSECREQKVGGEVLCAVW